MNKTLIFICAILLSIATGFVIGRFCRLKPPTIEPIIKVDTTFVHDTIKRDKPIYLTKRIVERELIPVIDTAFVHDTTFVYLDREQITWTDTFSTIYVSGIRPQVDSVFHYRTDRIITIEKTIPVKEKTRFGVGVFAGYGFSKTGTSPVVGLGVSYNLLSF